MQLRACKAIVQTRVLSSFEDRREGGMSETGKIFKGHPHSDDDAALATEVPLDEGMPEINPAKICFVIVKARELGSEDLGIEPDASNESDDRFTSILTDAGRQSVEAELRAFINALDEDEQAALVAMMWIGRGDYDAPDWVLAVAEARARRSNPVSDYLLGTPLLPDYLEIALAEYGESCEVFEMGRL
jgi:Protein of unknown function (DUF3775)